MLRAIFFDFNGVILDDEEYHYLSLKRVLEEEGVSISREAYYLDCLGFGDTECFEWGLESPERVLAAGGIPALVQRKSIYYEALLDREARFFPGVCELIREASGRFPLGVASMALRREIELALERADLLHLMTVVVSAEDVPRPKPAPDVYETALARMSRALLRGGDRAEISPHDCLVIEDSVPGIRSARAAGMRVLAVAHTVKESELAEADWVLPSLSHVPLQRLEAFMAGALP